MFTLGTNEFFRNMKYKLIVILQMTIVYVIAIFVTSSFIEQYKMMNALDGFLDDTGIILCASSSRIECDFVTEEKIFKDLIDVESVVTCYKSDARENACSLLGGQYFKMEMLYYDLDKLDYIPKLIEGDWCDDYKHTEGIINIIVSNYFPIDVSVGGTFELDGMTFRVTGIYDENEPVISPTIANPSRANGSYLDYYEVVRERNENTMLRGGDLLYLAFASYEDMIREGIEPYATNVITIDYKDDISNNDIALNERILAEKYGYIMNDTATDSKYVYDYSMVLLNIKLTPMLFIFGIVFVVSAASLITSGAINVLYEKRNYGVYFICGNNWNNTLLLSFINWSCIAGTSLILAVSASLLMKASGKFDNLALSFSIEHVIVIVTITVIMLLLALALPYRMLKKLQPVNILKDNDK